MEDNISTILYIVIGIIYFIYTALKKGKGKQQKRPSQHDPIPGNYEDLDEGSEAQAPPTRRPTFEDLLKEFTQAVEPQPKQSQPIPEYEDEIIEEAQTPTIVKESSPFNKYKDKPTTIAEQAAKHNPFNDYKNKDKPATIAEQAAKHNPFNDYKNVDPAKIKEKYKPQIASVIKHEEKETNSLAAGIREMLRDPEGIKKAIIANEILRPKYF